jgi:hypothetical protein
MITESPIDPWQPARTRALHFTKQRCALLPWCRAGTVLLLRATDPVRARAWWHVVAVTPAVGSWCGPGLGLPVVGSIIALGLRMSALIVAMLMRPWIAVPLAAILATAVWMYGESILVWTTASVNDLRAWAESVLPRR